VILTLLTGLTYFQMTEESSIFLLSLDVVIGLGPWSLVFLKDKVVVLGPGLGFRAQTFVKIPG